MSSTTVPFLGLGTGGESYPTGSAITEAVVTALTVGYRHVDTAPMYGNLRAVGEGVAQSPVDRDELFLSTKVSPADLHYDGVIDSLERSLDQLDVDAVDILYVHFPTGNYDPEETFAAFNALYDRGLIGAIGVSNFTPQLLDEASEYVASPILANQVELHPWCRQDALRRYARDHDLLLVAYAPLIRGRIFDDPVVGDVAEKHGISAAQVGLAWLAQLENVRAITKSTTRAHMVENLAAESIDLDPEDVDRIESIDRTEKLVDTTQR